MGLLVQLARVGGGFYSYDWIENLLGLDIHSVDRVLAEHQGLKRGDRVALAPDGSGLDVERIEPERLLILREPSGGWTWAFVLEPTGGETRLIARNRWTTAGGAALLPPLHDPDRSRGVRHGAKDAARHQGAGGVAPTAAKGGGDRHPLQRALRPRGLAWRSR